jgi:hypothetical protein
VSYIFWRRIRGPVFLLTFGFTALLHQWHVLSFGRSWPLYLIVYGLLRLAEGSALLAAPPAPSYTPPGYAPPPGYGSAGFPSPAPSPSTPGAGLTTIGPAHIQSAASTEEES